MSYLKVPVGEISGRKEMRFCEPELSWVLGSETFLDTLLARRFILEDLLKTANMMEMAATTRYNIETRHQRPNVKR